METQEKNKRKLLLALPILVLPFLALAFYAFGGGRADDSAQQRNVQQGINTSLPDAEFKKEDPQDKLSLYNMTGRDTTLFREQFGDREQQSTNEMDFPVTGTETDVNEQRINEKLAQINQQINRPETPVTYDPQSATNGTDMSGDVDRLEKLMQMMQEGKAEDPEMEQLSGILDKIISIQNPGSMSDKPLRDNASSSDSKFRAIPAIIVDNQKAVQGATIQLRLQDTITLNGQFIPEGHDIFGTCRITNQRLLLDIENIRLGTSIVPVDLSVYSLDGMEGIDAPEAELAGAAGSGADDALRSIGIYGIDQSIAAQVAGAGIDAAKGLFSKKIKRIRVKLEAGQPVLLRNNQLKNR